jgi:hypothetical protein
MKTMSKEELQKGYIDCVHVGIWDINLSAYIHNNNYFVVTVYCKQFMEYKKVHNNYQEAVSDFEQHIEKKK